MPSDLWTLNDDPFADLGVDDGVLTLRNGAADTLVLSQTLVGATQEPAAPFAYGDTVTLKRDGVVWFVGTVRDIDESVDRARSLVVRGAWDVLERKAYLQTFKTALDPDDPDSPLVDVVRGRVVLGQADDGVRVSLATFLASVITYAGLTPGTIDVALTVPFEDATDLSCAEVVERMLRWIPNSVVWFDYTTTPATVHIRQRANLTAATLAIGGAGMAWQEPLRLKPRHDLVVDNVVLLYVATNRSNAASWEVVLPDNGPGNPPGDRYPPESTGEEDGALVRTIELGGSIATNSFLTQEVETDEIPDALTAAALASGWVKNAAPNEATFASLLTWWRRHRPELRKENIDIVAFRSGERLNAASPETPITPDLRELVSGGLTEWMQEDDEDLLIEEQLVEVDVAYTISTKDDAGATKKQQEIVRLSAQIVATNAQTKTYSQLADASFTEAEEVPTGLAEALYNALNPLQWEGEVALLQEEATDLPRPGQTLNLTGGAAAWATMAAVVQARTTELGAGRTSITLGPPAPLSAAGLVEIYRTNRNRRPSTSYLVRATGRTGGEGGGALVAPLPIAQPIKPSQPSARVSARVFNRALTVAGVVPTAAEITTALQAEFTASNPPISGDIVNLTVGGVVKLRATVSAHGTAAGLYGLSFVVDGTTFWAVVQNVGLY